MPGQPYRVEVESIHWTTLLPSLRLFDSFKHALHPWKLGLAYLFVLLLVLGGQAMDLLWGRPIFNALVDMELEAFRRLVGSVLSLNFGLADLLGGAGFKSGGVAGALTDMTVGIPGWMLKTQPIYFIVYALYAYALLALFGGAISRLAALHAARDLRPAPPQGLRFALGWYVWFFVAPLLPLVVAAVFAALLALAGLALFNLPVLDVVGGLLYGPLMISGLIVTVVLVGLAVGAHVLYPGIAVEGTDAFDAISRAYNYVLGRPLRFLLYVLVGLVYFAVTFLIVSLIVYGTVRATEACIGFGAFANAREGVERFSAITPDVTVNGPTNPPAWAALDASGKTSAWLVNLWVKLLLLVLPAFAVSFYFCASTWVYLLLRRSADGVEFEDVYLDAPRHPEPEPAPEPEVGPAAATPAAAPPPPQQETPPAPPSEPTNA